MKNVEENNVLIAEFMGFFKARVSRGFAWDNNKITKPITLHGDLVGTRNNGRFHESWDWLMAAVDKIERSGYNVKIHTDYTAINKIKGKCVADMVGSNKLHNTYAAVIEFINQQNKK